MPVDVVYRHESSLEFALTMIVGNCWYWHAHGFLPSPTLERSVSGATRIATRPAPRHNTGERRLAFQFPGGGGYSISRNVWTRPGSERECQSLVRI